MVIETNGTYFGLGLGAIIIMIGKAIWNTSRINKDVEVLKEKAHVPPCREFTELNRQFTGLTQKVDDSIKAQDKNQLEILELLRKGCAWDGKERRDKSR